MTRYGRIILCVPVWSFGFAKLPLFLTFSRPFTPEAAGSSPVTPAILSPKIDLPNIGVRKALCPYWNDLVEGILCDISLTM